MIKDEILEKIGKVLISEVRDEAIDKYQMIASGSMKSVPALDLHKKLSTFNEDQLSLVRQVVVSSIDDVIYNFLWMLEQHEDDIVLSCGHEEHSKKENVVELSDGLSGEIYTEDGWIARHSTYKENY